MIEINATLATQILNFVILVAILRWLAYKPVVGMLEARSKKIASDIEKADEDKKAAAATLAKYQSELKNAQIKAQEILDRAEIAARDEHAKAQADTKREIELMKKNAAEEIEREKTQAVEALKSQMVTLSMAAAGKIIGKNITAKDNDAIIGEFISKLGKEKLGDLSC